MHCIRKKWQFFHLKKLLIYTDTVFFYPHLLRNNFKWIQIPEPCLCRMHCTCTLLLPQTTFFPPPNRSVSHTTVCKNTTTQLENKLGETHDKCKKCETHDTNSNVIVFNVPSQEHRKWNNLGQKFLWNDFIQIKQHMCRCNSHQTFKCTSF